MKHGTPMMVECQHTIHENGIPPEVAQRLEELYQSPFSTLLYFAIFKGEAHPHAMVLSRGESAPCHVVAYTIRGREMTVLNELVTIEQEVLDYFFQVIFERYPGVAAININCLKSRVVPPRYPWRLWRTSGDITIKLPHNFDAYQRMLGRQTRKHLRYYLNRLQRDHDDFCFAVAASHDIAPASIDRVIEMNRMRMKSKNIRSGFDSYLENCIREFCRYYGVVCTVSIGGRTVAGTICYVTGNHAYLEVVAHDPAYNRYNAGQACLYLTIKHMIEKGIDSFHLLWGENEYKYRFLGVRQDLYYLSVYRSHWARLRSLSRLMSHICSGVVNQLRYITDKYILPRLR